jgi:Tol biopolymer transport system component
LFSIDDRRSLRTTRPSGTATTIQVGGLFHPARPSVSPDGKWALVQAADHEVLTGGAGDDLDIYLIDVRQGSAVPISHESVNEESPEWIPGTDRVLWSSFDPQAGIDAVVYNVTTDQIVRRIPNGGGLHLDVAHDAKTYLDAARMQIYSLETGQLVADLRATILSSLRDAGYEPDDRYPGQANRGTFPMDGAFSPDGSQLVFDGAVKKEGAYGVIVARANRDGTAFQVLTPLLQVDPAFSNNHNFSQLNPMWI